jgi:hypothetical protein
VRGIFTGPVLDVDRSGGPYNGQLYVTFVDDCASCVHPDYDVYLTYSDDQGGTWSPLPQRGNVESRESTDFLPWVDVDQTSGSVNVIYYTTDGDPTGNDDVQVRIRTSIDGGVQFSQRTNLSDETSNAGLNSDEHDFLEYIGLAVHDGTIHGLWSDNSDYDDDLEVFTASASFSSSTDNNQLVITGDDAGPTNDSIQLRCSPVNTAFVEAFLSNPPDGNPAFAGLFETLDHIKIDGKEGQDVVTIVLTNGSPIPDGGLCLINAALEDGQSGMIFVDDVTLEIYSMQGDLDGNRCVDRDDLSIILADIRGSEPHNACFDLNSDSKVNIADARKLVLLFTNKPRGTPCVASP